MHHPTDRITLEHWLEREIAERWGDILVGLFFFIYTPTHRSSKTPGGPRTRVILKYGNSDKPMLFLGSFWRGGPLDPRGAWTLSTLSTCVRRPSTGRQWFEPATLHTRQLIIRSGQVRSECLTCTFRASCCSARLSRAQVKLIIKWKCGFNTPLASAGSRHVSWFCLFTNNIYTALRIVKLTLSNRL